VRASWVVNCAGLWAGQVASCIEGFPPQHIPKIGFAKGSYFSLSGASPFSALVYPAPRPGGHLGIHMTLDLGHALFWSRHAVSSASTTPLTRHASPVRGGDSAVLAGDWTLPLQTAYAGIRPKILDEGEASRDFCIQSRTHGRRGIG